MFYVRHLTTLSSVKELDPRMILSLGALRLTLKIQIILEDIEGYLHWGITLSVWIWTLPIALPLNNL